MNVDTLKDKKITLSTVKSFIKENIDNLYIRKTFITSDDSAEFIKAEKSDKAKLGIKGTSIIEYCKNYCEYFRNYSFEGFKVSSGIGNFVFAIKI